MFGSREELVGVLTRLEEFEPDDGGPVGGVDAGLGGINLAYRVYLDGHAEPIGWVHASKVLNRVEEGERVRVWRKPGEARIRKLRPADRKLRWWQF